MPVDNSLEQRELAMLRKEGRKTWLAGLAADAKVMPARIQTSCY